MEPVNLLDLKPEELKKFLDSFDHVFSDCDGVIWSKGPLPGSGKFFALMKKIGKTVNYVSNNSIRTREDYETQFASVDIENGFENLTIPSTAIAEYFKSIDLKKKIYCVSCDETKRVLESHGFECKDGPESPPDYYQDFLQFTEDDPEIGAVVFDSDFKVNLAKLHKAITYLKRPEVHFINGATDRIVPMKSGCLSLGPGAFPELVGEVTRRKPIQLGKPGKMFGEFAMKRAGVTDPSRVLFIGDMIEQDIGLGKAVGFKTMLVLSSATQEDMLANPTIRPDYYAPSLGSFVPILENITK